MNFNLGFFTNKETFKHKETSGEKEGRAYEDTHAPSPYTSKIAPRIPLRHKVVSCALVAMLVLGILCCVVPPLLPLGLPLVVALIIKITGIVFASGAGLPWLAHGTFCLTRINKARQTQRCFPLPTRRQDDFWRASDEYDCSLSSDEDDCGRASDEDDCGRALSV